MTIKEIARLAGVSISTVSKVMNRKDSSISPETRERVLRIIKEFNYTPYSNSHITSNSSKSYTIGVLVRNVEKTRALSSIMQAARSYGYTVLVSECADQPDLEFRGVTALCRHGVDGVLWEPLDESSLKFIESFRTSKIPFLLFNSTQIEGALNMNFEQMGYDATMSLVQTGHKEIACLLSEGTRTEGFLTGYKRCLFDSGISYQENLVFHDVSDMLIHKITSHTVTGIVSSHFTAANQLYGELYSRHYQIPYDVSLVTLRSATGEAVSFPKISTFAAPHYEYGNHLCEQLMEMIENPEHTPLPFEQHSVLEDPITITTPFTKINQTILVIGSINTDTYLKVDCLPSTGKSTITSASSVYPGGKAINQAVGVAKLGAHAALIGAVGNDMESDLIYEAMKEHGIDSSGIHRSTDHATGKAYVLVQQDGDSMISILSGANDSLTPEDIHRNSRLFENSAFCLVQTEIPSNTVLAACQMAKKHHVTTILKPSSCNHLAPELLKYVDILIPNMDELELLGSGDTAQEKIDYFLKQGVNAVIVTLGSNGCLYKTATAEGTIPAASFHPVDNTGACDAFISALAVYLQEGYSLDTALRIATYAAGFSVTRESVPNSLIDRGTLETYITQINPDLLHSSR